MFHHWSRGHRILGSRSICSFIAFNLWCLISSWKTSILNNFVRTVCSLRGPYDSQICNFLIFSFHMLIHSFLQVTAKKLNGFKTNETLIGWGECVFVFLLVWNCMEWSFISWFQENVSRPMTWRNRVTGELSDVQVKSNFFPFASKLKWGKRVNVSSAIKKNALIRSQIVWK